MAGVERTSSEMTAKLHGAQGRINSNGNWIIYKGIVGKILNIK